MHKLNWKQSVKLKLLHQTSKRARYFCDILTNDTNILDLEKDLVTIDGVSKVRINQKTKSIIFDFENVDLKDIESKLLNVNIGEFEVCDTILTHNISCVDDEVPSKQGIYRATAALAIEPLLRDDAAKIALTTGASLPLLVNGTKELFTEGLTSGVLESLAVGVSIARKDYLSANGTNAMLELGEYIEETTVHKSDDLIKELAKPNIKEVWIEEEKDGKKELKKVETKSLNIGDIVVIGAGDTIAIDGHIISGAASVNQVSMTGESEAVKKEQGNKVISGTVVEDGRIKVWAEHVGDDTATARIKNYITSSLNDKSSVELKATKLANSLVPVTLGLAGLSYGVSNDFERVASVLQADYSCALKLATPVAFKTSISQAGKNGILIKGAKSIEALNEADTFVFDKTGTLTYGELEVESINSFDDNWSEEDVLNLTASAEEHYFHPVAQAIVSEAKKQGFIHKHHEDVEFVVAHGVKTIVDGKEVLIGSRHFLEDDENIDFKKHKAKIEKCLLAGKTILYVAYGGKLLGTVGMRDRVRENAKSTIAKLKSMGVKKIIMLTGDIEAKALVLAKELGIDKVYANMHPEDKANIIKELRDGGAKVAFVGDGINDAPALINANVGISMSKGADIAKATADVGLLKDDIDAVAQAKEISIKTMNLINSNFNVTVGVNSCILVGAALGFFNPITTAVLHNGTTIGLLANSMKGIRVD